MRKIVVKMNLTLDGVMQAPGSPDEDPRDGFTHGGWALPYFDAVMAGQAASGMAQMPALLFGRRTYERFYAFWPQQTDNPFTGFLDHARKYVASTTLTEPLPWNNSVLLKGDAAATVAALKQQPGEDLLIMGSGELIQTLMRHNLVDVYVLSIHPLVLGTGHRLFPDGSPYAALRLVETTTTTTGVVMATYLPAETPIENPKAKSNGHEGKTT
jgi:dihydrofolate reductase